MKHPLIPASTITTLVAYADTCASFFTSVLTNNPSPVAAALHVKITGTSSHGRGPQLIPNSTFPAKNSATVWATEMT